MKSSTYDVVRGRLINRRTGNKVPDSEPVAVLRASCPEHLEALKGIRTQLPRNSPERKEMAADISTFVAFIKGEKDIARAKAKAERLKAKAAPKKAAPKKGAVKRKVVKAAPKKKVARKRQAHIPVSAPEQGVLST